VIEGVRAVLSRSPATFRALIEGASPGAVEFHEKPGAWSPRQVLCHVADAEITDWRPRVALILGSQEDKRFTPFDREGGFARYKGWTAASLLDEFERLRHGNLARLDELNVTDADFERQGLHPDLGVVTLSQLLACWATHDLAHIEQITRALVRHRGPEIGPWRKYYSLLSDQ
jgi:DinB family protein